MPYLESHNFKSFLDPAQVSEHYPDHNKEREELVASLKPLQAITFWRDTIAFPDTVPSWVRELSFSSKQEQEDFFAQVK